MLVRLPISGEIWCAQNQLESSLTSFCDKRKAASTSTQAHDVLMSDCCSPIPCTPVTAQAAAAKSTASTHAQLLGCWWGKTDAQMFNVCALPEIPVEGRRQAEAGQTQRHAPVRQALTDAGGAKGARNLILVWSEI